MTQPGEKPALSGRLVLLMAVTTGAVVANLYYAQPLLNQVSRSLDIGTAGASTVVTATQIGFPSW